MFVKFVNKKQISVAPNPIHGNGVIIANPTSETLRALGYKELVVEDMPKIPDGKTVLPVYTDGDVITQGWEITDEPAE